VSKDPLTEDFAVLAYIDYLKSDGWTIVSHCLGRQRGTDIVASKGNQKLLVEAKGARGNQADKNVVRRIFDSGQVKDHLGKAIVKVLELRLKHNGATLVVLHTGTDLVRKIVDPVGKQLKASMGIEFAFVKPDRRVSHL
jgi:Holliday junction resolvase-like predicted endonuclease